MNLVEQQNMLRELSDGQLSQAMNSGVAPQYLVVAEAKRREDARKRYVTLKQKYDATVAETVMQGLGPSAQGMLGGGQPMAAPGGLDAALPGAPMDAAPAPEMPMGIEAAMPPGPPAFAKGGPVHRYQTGNMVSSIFAPEPADDLIKFRMAAAGMAGLPSALPAEAAPIAPPTAAAASMTPLSFNYPEFNDPYAELRDLYASQVDELDAERERAGALALISAGLGIAGGKSQNFARNLAGAQDAIKGYGERMGDIEARRQALMQGQVNAATMSRQALSEMKKNFPDTAEGRRQMATQMGLDTSLPEVQAFIATGQNAELAFGIGGKYSKGFIEGENVKTGKPVWARYNESKKQFEDADGNPIPFREYTTEEAIANKTRAAELAKDKLVPSEYLRVVNNASDIQSNTARVNGQVSQAADLVRSGKVTGVFQMAEAAPGPQRELASLVSTLKSNAAINAMRRLRETSTGGTTGFGQITQTEFKALEDSLTALDRFSDPETFMRQLQVYQDSLMQMYRKAAIYLNQTLEDNPDVRKPKFENDMGIVLDLNSVDQNISDFTKAFTGEPVAPGGNDTGISLAPPVPERDMVTDIFNGVWGN